MENNEKIFGFLDTILSKNISWINVADTKAGFVFLMSTSMAGVLAALMPTFSAMTCLMLWGTAISFFLLGASVLFLFFVNFPHLNGALKSLIFFGGISTVKADKYIEKVLNGTTQEILEDMAFQCHRTAQIASYKFKYLKISFQFLFAAILPWILTIILFYQTKFPT